MKNRLSVRELRFYEREVKFRLAFRFGMVTMTGGPQAFVRARIALEDGAESWGMAAEMLAAKWFDKNPELSHEDNYDQLRMSVRLAAQLYTSDHEYHTPFGLFAKCYESQISGCAERGLNPLIASFGPAFLDRAILDALCRLHRTSFYEAVRNNLPGLKPEELLPEFAGFDFDAFLKTLRPRDSIHARHTVGLVDPLTAEDQKKGRRVGDGLPETLEEVVQTYRNRYFKIKVGGDVQEDVARLTRIAEVLDRNSDEYYVTLDGNEQYDDLDEALELWGAMKKARALERFVKSILFIEQPINRKASLDRDVGRLSTERPVVIDESDADLGVFPRARSLGYQGVSSKACKGFYKSLLNTARCARWNEEAGHQRYFMTGEDLTTQAGIAVQQDLALVSLIGLEHLERNGHHYVNGMAGLPKAEQQAFLKAHSDLYWERDGVVRLHIDQGQLKIGSLKCPGFGAGAEPGWSSMREV